MAAKQKLELTWIGKENRPRLEPRILLEDPEKSYHACQRVTDNDIFDNRLIFGDNLLAIKALVQDYTGRIKCIFIDPPYNTGSAFDHYDDGVEHSTWLTLMRDRIELLRTLLAENGSLWVTLDDNEAHYFKVMADEIFGRRNFVADIAWQKKHAPGNNEKGISSDSDHLLVWAKNTDRWQWNLLPRTDKQDALYRNPDNDPRGPWQPDNLTRAEYRERDFWPIETPSGRKVYPPAGRSWSRPPKEIERLRADNRLWFGPNGDAGPRLKRFLSEVQNGVVARTVWLREDVGSNDEAKKEAKALNSSDMFATPKPERLIHRILQVATNPGDLVLDSFGGSGTTAGVAHKMGRRWIMVELGEHCHTHIIPRLKKVIDGEDEGGITDAAQWKGGGGFRYYHLAPTLLAKDPFDNLVISKEYNAGMLAEAMCKLMGFRYEPSEDAYWQQGRSTESDFIYVTTQTLTKEQLTALSEEVGDKRSLLVCCSAFRCRADAFPNLTLKKIPLAVLHKCEWGHDDYSLNIANLPRAAAAEPEPLPAENEPAKHARRRRGKPELAPSLFDGGAE